MASDFISRELEAKYLLAEEQIPLLEQCLERLSDEGDILIAGERQIDITDYYFDTSDFLLASNKASLRLRQRPDRQTKLTFKVRARKPENAMHDRFEIEGSPEPALIHAMLDKAPWLAIRQDANFAPNFKDNFELMSSLGLTNVYRIVNSRTIYTVVTNESLYTEISIDQGAFINDGIRVPFSELEVEFLSGNRSDFPMICNLLEKHISWLQHSEDSKYLQGLQNLKLWRSTGRKSPERKWKKRLETLFRRFDKSYNKSIQSANARDLHKTRVAIREMLSIIEFLPAVRKSGTSREHVYSNLKRIQKELGKLRDLDVHVQYLESNSTYDPETNRSLMRLLKLKRELEFYRKQDALKSIHDRSLLKHWSVFINSDLPQALTNTNIAQDYIDLRKRFERYLHDFNDARLIQGPTHPDTIKKLHKSRIVAKRIRYATENLDFLLPGSNLESIGHYTAIQDQFGEINDKLNFLQFLEDVQSAFHALFNDEIRLMIEAEQSLAAGMVSDIRLAQLLRRAPADTKLLELQKVKGIGIRSAEILTDAGVSDLKVLARLTEQQISANTTLPSNIVNRALREKWIEQARNLTN